METRLSLFNTDTLTPHIFISQHGIELSPSQLIEINERYISNARKHENSFDDELYARRYDFPEIERSYHPEPTNKKEWYQWLKKLGLGILDLIRRYDDNIHFINCTRGYIPLTRMMELQTLTFNSLVESLRHKLLLMSGATRPSNDDFEGNLIFHCKHIFSQDFTLNLRKIFLEAGLVNNFFLKTPEERYEVICNLRKNPDFFGLLQNDKSKNFNDEGVWFLKGAISMKPELIVRLQRNRLGMDILRSDEVVANLIA